jgi:hypothetical protein
VRKALKEHVVSRDIYVSNANTRSPVPVQLADLLDLKKCPKWPANELAKVAKGPVFGTEGPAFATTQALKPGSRSATPIPTAATPRLSSRLVTPVPTALVTSAQVPTARTANSATLAANAKEPQFQESQFQNSQPKYPRLSPSSPPFPSITARAAAVRKAMAEVRKLKTERQVAEAFATRNGPSVAEVAQLPLQNKVRVWRKNDD